MPSLAQAFWVSGALFTAVFIIGVWLITGITPRWFVSVGIALLLVTVASGLVVGIRFMTTPLQADSGREAVSVDATSTPTVAAPVATPAAIPD